MINSNSFCVVETEDKTIFECPRSWYIDESNIVYYPSGLKYNAWKGRKDKPANSPGAKWLCEKARLIKSFHDYESAVEAAKALENMHTSDEETFFTTPRSVAARRGVPCSINVQNLIDQNSQSLPLGSSMVQTFPECDNQENAITLDGYDVSFIPIIQDGIVEQENVMLNNFDNQQQITIQGIDNSSISGQQFTEDLSNQSSDNVTIKPAIIDESLVHIVNIISSGFGKIEESQKNLFKEIKKLNEKIDMLSFSSTSDNRHSEATSFHEVIQLVPVKSEASIESLNQILFDKNIFKMFVESMSRFGGTSGAKTGQKVALQVIDNFFDREFLLQCSWTGGSKGKTENKINFSAFKNVILSFFQTINNADNRFSINEAENFIRAQLRNSKNRFLQTHKRPAQLLSRRHSQPEQLPNAPQACENEGVNI